VLKDQIIRIVGFVLAGAFAIGALVPLVILTIAFVRNQRQLTKEGIKRLNGFDDVLQLMTHNWTAFARFSDASIQGRPAGSAETEVSIEVPQQVNAEQQLTAQEDQHVPRPVGEGKPAPPRDSTTETRASEARRTKPFWTSLTPAEQRALKARAQEVSFPVGVALLRQDQPADHVLVIRSGLTKVFVEETWGERILAYRGPDEILGERAVLETSSRSATVIAVEPVLAYLISTEAFASIVYDHPRVLRVVEKQIYDRLTESNAALVPELVLPRAPIEGAPTQGWSGQNCTILFSDITRFGAVNRKDGDRAVIRQVMYRILRNAFKSSGVPPEACRWEDRGDGALVIVPETIATRRVVDPLLARLAGELERHNRHAEKSQHIQLRIAINVGPVMSDPEGVSGEAIIKAARMVNEPILKQRVTEESAHLGIIASDFVYENTIRHTPCSSDSAKYERIEVNQKGVRMVAHVHLSGPRG
jgi:CRP-like cAMP-binding protein